MSFLITFSTAASEPPISRSDLGRGDGGQQHRCKRPDGDGGNDIANEPNEIPVVGGATASTNT
jgi:hypothetical protein